MSDYAESYNIIQAEQVVTRRPTSESLFQPFAGSVNLMLKNGVYMTRFKLNGSYKGGTTLARFDGFERLYKNVQIIAAAIFNGSPGTSGTTEVDIKRFTASGGVGTSIFSVTPKVASTAPANSWAATGESVSGVTAPVLTSTPLNLNAGDTLQANLVSSMAGNPRDLQVEVYWLLR